VKRRHVLLSVARWGGGNSLAELLRTAVAMASGYEGHRVEIALIGEGVLTAASPAGDNIQRYYRAARSYPIPIYAEQESLERLKLEAEKLSIEVEPKTRAELVEICRQAEHQLRI
jgi:sulfur relay (sulfurtransferase) DsrF/TusC family protein